MERNALAPEDVVSASSRSPPTSTRVPRRRRAPPGLRAVPLLCAREIPVPGALPRVIRVLIQFYADESHTARHVYLGEASRLRADLEVSAVRPVQTLVIASSEPPRARRRVRPSTRGRSAGHAHAHRSASGSSSRSGIGVSRSAPIGPAARPAPRRGPRRGRPGSLARRRCRGTASAMRRRGRRRRRPRPRAPRAGAPPASPRPGSRPRSAEVVAVALEQREVQRRSCRRSGGRGSAW